MLVQTLIGGVKKWVDVPAGLVKAGASTFSAAIAGTDYQAPLSAGTGVSIASNTVSIGQAVGTTSSVQFSRVSIGRSQSTFGLEVYNSPSSAIMNIECGSTNSANVRCANASQVYTFGLQSAYSNGFGVADGTVGAIRWMTDTGGSFMLAATTPPSGAARCFIIGGGSSSPNLGAQSTDTVQFGRKDNGAGNAEFLVRPESGMDWGVGGSAVRRILSSTQEADEVIASTTTTDATQTTVYTLPIASNYTYLVDVDVVARRTGGVSGAADDGASYSRSATYTKKTGTVTLMGSIAAGADAEDQPAWDVTLTISGANVLVRVTGDAGNSITWLADIRILKVSS